MSLKSYTKTILALLQYLFGSGIVVTGVNNDMEFVGRTWVHMHFFKSFDGTPKNTFTTTTGICKGMKKTNDFGLGVRGWSTQETTPCQEQCNEQKKDDCADNTG